MTNFETKLDLLASSERITEKEFKHFLLRGIQFEKFGPDFPNLRNYFPTGIPIGASETFIDNLDIPYQETSYVCASTGTSHPRTYLYKTDTKFGGVIDLFGGKRSLGDTIFASLNRILLGNKAIMLSADNLIANSNQIWDWYFFGKYLSNEHPRLFDELKLLAERKLANKPTQVILARKKSTFEKLDFLKKYMKNNISIFDSDRQIIFLTNNEGFDYASGTIIPDERIHYVVETTTKDKIDIIKCLQTLRKKFGITQMLNDGGRRMTLGLKRLNVLGGERVSYEPFPGKKFVPEKIHKEMILGQDGIGIDGSAIKDSFVVYSHKLKHNIVESLNLHLYSMDKLKQ